MGGSALRESPWFRFLAAAVLAWPRSFALVRPDCATRDPHRLGPAPGPYDAEVDAHANQMIKTMNDPLRKAN